ncbi:hypothetical protein [Streptomyces longisporoflavus]|uniref:Uncharacterized protein n=1 Tax=Streptomyces longisporoflavus TaxID=28044 RepID=A0ABW7R050_9ACTN
MQNASTLSTTSGSRAAVTPITDEWRKKPSPAQVAGLDQYDRYSSSTVDSAAGQPQRVHDFLSDHTPITRAVHLARPRDYQ